MKINLVSDIHLEFDYWRPSNKNNAEVLILAGDIIPASYISRAHMFFEQCAKLYSRVFYVLGNHEYYGSIFDDVYTVVKQYLSNFDNIHVLQNEVISYQNIDFIGTTLWTNCNNTNPLSAMVIEKTINDFIYIAKTNTTFIGVNDYIIAHNNAIKFLTKALDNNNPAIVITHYLPSFSCIPAKYKHEIDVNGGYASNLDEFILDHENIKYWVHGHTHDSVNMMIGGTNIICNPRGIVNIDVTKTKYDKYKPKEIII